MTITTEEFRGLYGLVAASLGQPALPTVFIPHPIVSVSSTEMGARAERAFPAIAALATESADRLRAEPAVRRGAQA